MIFIEDFYQTSDGNDWLPAFQRAQTTLGVSTSPYAFYGGFTLHFRARAYFFSDTLQVLRPLCLMGSGGVANPGTVLMFPKGKKGVIFHGQASNLYPEYGGNPALGDGFSQGASMEKIMLLAVDPLDQLTPAITHAMLDFRESSIFPNQNAHGVTLYTQATLRDVTISNFDGHGVYVFGNGDDDLSRPQIATHNAFWQLANIFVSANGGDGLHTYGQDASGGVVIACQFVGNCGWGVCDLNYLGQGTYTSGQSSYNVTGGVARPFFVQSRDFDHYAELLNLAQAINPNPMYPVLAVALPGVLAGVVKPNPDDFALIQESYQTHMNNPQYWQNYRDYRDAWDAYAKAIGDQLEAALLAAGMEADQSKTHLDFGNPYAAGGNIFLNYYAESNGVGEGVYNQLGATNFCINSPFISHNTDSLAWEAAGYRNTMQGIGGLTAQSLETNQLTLNDNLAAPHTISYRDTQPTDNAPLGTIVFNSNPVAGGFVGWVSLGGGNWGNFGAIN